MPRLSSWKRRRSKALSRQVVKALGILLLALAVLVVTALFQADPPMFLAAAAKFVAALAGALTIITGMLKLAERGGGTPQPVDIRSPKLREDQPIFDREEQVADLTSKIGRRVVVNCHGPRGSGKSYVLQYLADVVNGHRKPSSGHSWPRSVSAALYFDLSDAVGFGGIESQICRATFGENGTWRQFIGYVERELSGRHALLILDNVNARSLWSPVGKAVNEYLLARQGDTLVVGSIDSLRFDTRNVAEVKIPGLDIASFGELAAHEGVALDGDSLVELHTQWGGLPYYAGPRGTRHAALAERAELAPGTRRLAAYAALIAVVRRRIDVRELSRCPIADFDAHLDAALRERLLTPTADPQLLTMHDLARDDVLENFDQEIRGAAAMLFERARGRGNDVDAAVFAMFADPARIGAERFDSALLPAIRGAVDSRDYALLESLYEKSRANEPLLEFLASDSARSDLFSLGRASQLAGVGDYEAAELELAETSITSRGHRATLSTELQLELRYLQADLGHLLNRYELAALEFAKLAETARSGGYERLRARCVWAQGHVLRHQGRDLDRAMALFRSAEQLATFLDMVSVKSQSVTNAACVKVFLDAVPEDEEDRLARIEEEVAASHAHSGHMLGIWKAEAQVHWVRGRADRAMAKVEDTIGKATALNDRLLYDLYFERAEFTRLSGEGAAAIDDYARALRFARGNRDRNLIANAMLGLVLADVSTGGWGYHGSKLEALGAAMEARAIASEADIQITMQLAGRVVSRLEGGIVDLPTRLIVF